MWSLVLIHSNAAPSLNSRKKLSHVNQEINRLQQGLVQYQQKREQQQAALAKTEINLSHLNDQLQTTQVKLTKEQDALSTLEKARMLQEKKLTLQQQALADHIESIYQLGEEPLLQLLLSEEAPEKIQRMIAYYRLIYTDCITRIQTLKNTLSELHTNLQTTLVQTQKLQSVKQKQENEKEQYHATYRERQQIIVTLNQAIDQRAHALKQLRLNREQLAAAIKTAQQNLQNTPPSIPFTGKKGLFSWPTPGPVTEQFQTPIAHSELKRDGILIQAPAGQSVRAIADGQVIFSKWLAGYGLLLIIDHGKGYMSLYGRNQKIYKSVGETVHRNEVIAQVGQTGGYEKTGLYFAIRHNAKPLDPNQWCRKNV